MYNIIRNMENGYEAIDELVDLYEEGSNIIITGQAGVGKSYLLNTFREFLEEQEVNFEIAASTGMASINIGATTVHRLFGIGISKDIDDYNNRINSGDIYFGTLKKSASRLKNADVIIIDEISMVGAKLMDLIDYVLKSATGINAPFGGKQLIFIGDFLQLPPINDKFAFESDAWKSAQFNVMNLTKVYRQEDSKFIDVLGKVRLAEIDEEVYEFIKEKAKPGVDTTNYTKLYARNNKVDEVNLQMLNTINEDAYEFVAVIEGPQGISKKMITPEVLTLKVGARVMSTANHDDLEYVNGSLGIVKRIENNYVVVKFDNGSVNKIVANTWWDYDGKTTTGSFTQIPLKLAYAITIHKSQGQTIDGTLLIDSEGIFEDGQFYVALSRIRDHNKLVLLNPRNEHIKANPKAIQFYNDLKK